MFIYPLNIEGFYFKELPDEVKLQVINNKITFIIKNLDNTKYSTYKTSIESNKCTVNYREFLKQNHFENLVNDIISENRLYDIHGNMFNIISKDNKHILYLTKTTTIPIELISTENYNISCENDFSLLITDSNSNTNPLPLKKLAKQFVISKFANKDSDTSDLIDLMHEAE